MSDRWIDGSDAHLVEGQSNDSLWWSSLNDPMLDNLIRTAYDQNLSLREAGWRVEQAYSARAIAVGSLFPQTQQGFGQYERILNSESLATPTPLRSFDSWSTGLNVAWEADVWGRYRRSIAAADANVQVAVGDYDAILICLIAEVASTYTDYRTAQLQLEYAQQNLQIQESSLKLTETKADLGSTSYIGVYLAQSSLESTRSGIPNLEIKLRQATNQLCTLLGMPTQDLATMLGESPIPTAPPEVAVGIPANLLRRRPDVRAAEQAVASQSEQIGIAIADLYPSFSIAGQIAFDSERFSDLLNSASSAGTVSPGFQWDVLNYGRIANNVELQQNGMQELIASYQNTVLSANQEVEDALVAFLQTQQRYQALKKSVTATEEALRLLTLSFDEGDIDFSAVFLLQGELVGAQNQLAETQGDIVKSLIGLYKALGGGWEIRCSSAREAELLVSTPVNEAREQTPNHQTQLARRQPSEQPPVPDSAIEIIHQALSRNQPGNFSNQE